MSRKPPCATIFSANQRSPEKKNVLQQMTGLKRHPHGKLKRRGSEKVRCKIELCFNE